jgi:hypothetical protein
MILAIGAVLLGIGIVLIVIGRPDKAGVPPKFLGFQASTMLYPPLILVFFALGGAAMISGYFGLH